MSAPFSTSPLQSARRSSLGSPLRDLDPKAEYKQKKRMSRRFSAQLASPTAELVPRPILHLDTDNLHDAVARLSVKDDPTEATLSAVRARVAEGVAFRTIRDAVSINGVRVGVALAHTESEHTLRAVISHLKHALLLSSHLFAVAPADPPRPPLAPLWPLVIIGSDAHLVDKAATLACAKFLGRVRDIRTASDGLRWVAYIEDTGSSAIDEALLWDVVRKTPHVINPKSPPLGARGIVELVAAARTRLERVTPKQALSELHDLSYPLPVVLVDIRPQVTRSQHGEVPDSLVVDRNVLEWRFDPRSESRLSIADRFDLRIILFCQDGSASSLAAASLHDIGLLNATDIIGGFQAWKEAALPTFTQPPPSALTITDH